MGALTELPEDPSGAWVSLLRAHSYLTRKMDVSMQTGHGLSLNEYEVLLQIHLSEEGCLRGVDLADHLLITQGGATRLLATLEGAGLVERCSSPQDGRVVLAKLTEPGRRTVIAARRDHLSNVTSMFSDHFTELELETLAEHLSRLHPIA